MFCKWRVDSSFIVCVNVFEFEFNLPGTMGWIQVGLGISTLLLYVPVPVAAAHQSGALVTLSIAMWLAHEAKFLKVLKKLPK